MILNEPSADFNRKWSGCAVRMLSPKNCIYFIESITSDSIKGYYASQVNTWKRDSTPLSEAEFDWSFPLLGYINFPTFTCYLQRVPVRQWRRGYAESVISPEYFFPGPSPKIPLSAGDIVNADTVKIVFNNHFPTPTNALKQLKGGKTISRAISPVLAVAMDKESPYFTIFYKKIKIGHISPEIKTIRSLRDLEIYKSDKDEINLLLQRELESLFLGEE